MMDGVVGTFAIVGYLFVFVGIVFLLYKLLPQNRAGDESMLLTPAPSLESAEPDANIRVLRDRLSASQLPAADILVANMPPETPAQSRLGGAVYLGVDEAWPVDVDGQRMVFVTQINFSEMPILPDFPTSGILQVFIPQDDLFGMDFDDPSKSDIAIIWRDVMPEQAVRHTQTVNPDISPFQTYEHDTEQRGRALEFVPELRQMRPSLSDWRFNRMLAGKWEMYNEKQLDDLFDELDCDRAAHYVGGHIRLTQSDFRGMPAYQEHDRVLLQIGSDDHIMWGDVGEMFLVIRPDDLRNKRFDKAVFWWDCC
jgi:uncharacterized protein YwqG